MTDRIETLEKYIENIQAAKTTEEIIDKLEELENLGLNDSEELVVLLSLPDEIFKEIMEPFLLEMERSLNTPEGRLNLMQSIEKEGIDIEAFLKNISKSMEEIDKTETSPLKKDFLKRMLIIFNNFITSNTTSVRRIFTIPIEICNSDAKIPTYANLTDAGMDIYALEDITINPGETVLLKTGFKVAIPDGYELQVRPKSGISLKTKLRIANTPGTIDTGYRDEVGVIVENIEHPIQDIGYDFDFTGTPVIKSILHGKSYTIEKGQKIAQLVLCEVPKVIFQQVSNINEIEGNRGGGFGSTGLK